MHKKVHSEAHGKVILIGEHSVVYHYGALVAPFNSDKIHVTISKCEEGIHLISSYHTGPLFSIGAPIEGIQALVKFFLEKYNYQHESFQIEIKSTLLSRRGLGSSAAVAKALGEGLFKYFDLRFYPEDLTKLINVSELVYHARPSGIDMNAVMNQNLLYYKDGSFKVVKPKFKLHIVVVDSGKPSRTRNSVAEVAAKVAKDDQEVLAHLKALGELADTAYDNLEHGRLELFARALKTSQIHLSAIGVSSPELDRLIDLAYLNDALAAKLTGGGQGGCMFALFVNEEKAHKFAKIVGEQGYQHKWQLLI